MDEFFRDLDGRLRVSGMLADSIMMGIVNSAMENAYNNSCSKEGDLVRLNEKSRFCELATMQLEWCLKFLQQQQQEEEEEEEEEETRHENNIHFVENNCDRERLLSDLLVTRDRIHNRLKETELMIAEKDRELSERMEIESNLRLALEVKDEDITSLNTVLGLEREKKRKRRSKKSMENIGEVKSYVDDQLKKIKAKLEDLQHNLRGLMRRMSSPRSLDFDRMLMVSVSDLERDVGLCNSPKDANSSMLERVDNLSLGIKLKDMAIDVDILKENVDSSFKTVAGSVSLLKTMLDEQAWVWNAEREMVNIITTAFLSEVQCLFNFDPGASPMLMDTSTNWSAFMDDITSLLKALEKLAPKIENEINYCCAAGEGVKEAPSMLGKVDYTEEFSEESPSCPSVAQKIRSHEFIIQKKAIELDTLKGERCRKNGCLTFKSEANLDYVKDMLARVNSSVKSIMKEREKFVIQCDDLKWRVGRDEYIPLQNTLSPHILVEKESKGFQSMGAIPEKSSSRSCCNLTHSELSEEINKLIEEKQDIDHKSIILEETYSVIFTGLMRRLNVEYNDIIIDTQVMDDTYSNILSEMIKEWSNNTENFNADKFFMEETYCHLLNEVIKDISYTVNMSQVKRKQELHSLPDHFNVRENRELDFNPVSLESYSDQNKGEVEESNEQYDVFSSMSGRSRNAFQKLNSSKMELKEVFSTPHHENVLYDQVVSIIDAKEHAKRCRCLPKGHEARKVDEFQFVMKPFSEFSKNVMEFEVLACDKIRRNMTRYYFILVISFYL